MRIVLFIKRIISASAKPTRSMKIKPLVGQKFTFNKKPVKIANTALLKVTPQLTTSGGRCVLSFFWTIEKEEKENAPIKIKRSPTCGMIIFPPVVTR